jgi:VIT1/CCC1 family predicted Fe2+/Mn2+ transporter
MTDVASKSSVDRVLEPSERVAEVLFGLIMVLTFTGSLSVAEAQADRAEVRIMLIGALGCNIAWGVIDGVLYLMGQLAERGRNLRAWRALKNAATPEAARAVIAEVLPEMMADRIGVEGLDVIRQKLGVLPEPPARPSLGRQDWLGALMVFVWVFITTFPVAIPFIFMQDVAEAMRMSNLIAVVMLFVTGYAFGRCSEYHPLLTGAAMVVLGSVLVAFTMALGG